MTVTPPTHVSVPIGPKSPTQPTSSEPYCIPRRPQTRSQECPTPTSSNPPSTPILPIHVSVPVAYISPHTWKNPSQSSHPPRRAQTSSQENSTPTLISSSTPTLVTQLQSPLSQPYYSPRRSAMLPLLQQPQFLPLNLAKLIINDPIAASMFFGQQILF